MKTTPKQFITAMEKACRKQGRDTAIKGKSPKAAREAPHEIDFDTWAESGGHGGIFSKGVKNGSIKIVDL